MASEKLRRQIACEAARLIYVRQESEYYRAKLKAARQIVGGWVKHGELPTNREIRDEIQALARMFEGERRADPDPPHDQALAESDNQLDRFQIYQALLAPLEHVKQNPKRHPEGDALCHSLQVFDLARDELPYDEEFLLAALLHDVGKAIDPREHVPAALDALSGHISERTAWLIEHHLEAAALRDGTLGVRARRRLESHESFPELQLLARCDRRGRQKGVAVPELDEAIDYLRNLARMCG
jgi:predicted HD phosphohydrolase